jgi:hypothetical protein
MGMKPTVMIPSRYTKLGNATVFANDIYISLSGEQEWKLNDQGVPIKIMKC